MTSLFSSFDLGNFWWATSAYFLVVIMFFSSIWKFTLKSSLLSLVTNSLNQFFSSLKSKQIGKSFIFLLNSLVFMIFFLNFMSIFPFNFALTSQFGLVFSASLIFWGSSFLFYSFNNMKGVIMHLIPEGTPMPLVSPLFLIESMSNSIRPLTLAVRLTANILAGHLLLILLSKLIFLYNGFFPLLLILSSVELFVSLIQSYIFCTMISLYMAEIH